MSMNNNNNDYFRSIGAYESLKMVEEMRRWRELVSSLTQEPVAVTSTKPDTVNENPYQGGYRYDFIRPIGEPMGTWKHPFVTHPKKNDVTIEVVERKKDDV